jgi:hypothetical protein
MPSMYTETGSNTLITEDWVRATQDLRLPPMSSQSECILSADIPATHSPIFGTHIREAIAIIKDWVQDSKK